MSRTITVAFLLIAGFGICGHAPAQDNPTKAVKIRDHIYMAPFGSNAYLIITPAGNVLIDTGTEGSAADVKKLLDAGDRGPVLGGLEFDLFSTPGETPDQLTVWVPAYKTAFIGDSYAGAGIPEPMSFPNIYTLRGTRPRPALDWIKSIDALLTLQPEVVLSGHGDPIFGNAEITRRLTRFRNAIQYVHDEVVKGMNAGKDVYTLMQEIKLPASYDLSEVFGKVGWSVRGIYDGYAGWFDTNPATMYSESPSAIYPDLVKLAGGPEPLVYLALEKLKSGQAVETLHLTDVVLAYDPKSAAALEARLKALDYLRQRSENVIEDGWLQFAIRKAKQQLLAR